MVGIINKPKNISNDFILKIINHVPETNKLSLSYLNSHYPDAERCTIKHKDLFTSCEPKCEQMCKLSETLET
jgi:hypothetical protein